MITPGWAPSTPASKEPVAGGDLAVLELRGVLAEVPDRAVGVLGVPVEGVLDDLAVEGDGVADDAGGDAVGDLAGHCGGGDDDAHLLAVLGGLPVGPAGARIEREPRVGHLGGELGGVELDRFVGLRAAPRAAPCPRTCGLWLAGSSAPQPARPASTATVIAVATARTRWSAVVGLVVAGLGLVAVALGAHDLEVGVELDVTPACRRRASPRPRTCSPRHRPRSR